MNEYQEKAWSWLTKDEQDSLLLTLTQGLSSWRASEALGITHYKYLELKARSEKLFRLFCDYLEIHHNLIPPRAPIGEHFRDFITGCIEKRLSKNDAVIYGGDSKWYLREILANQLRFNMDNLRNSSDKWCNDLYALILEFDRWNNFRILPLDLQAPSPYRRRSQKKYKIYLRFLFQIPDFKINSLILQYNNPGRGRHYIAVISLIFPKNYKLIPVSRSQKITKELSKKRIYVFENKGDAETFGLLASQYYTYTQNIKTGQRFWNNFYDAIEKAVNFKEINHIDFNINLLEKAYSIKKDTTKMKKLKSKI